MITKNKKPYRPGVLIGIPTTGIVRYEWHSAMQSLVIPTNWACSSTSQFIRSTMGYTVAEGRNKIVQQFLSTSYEWLFFIDHDVLLPPNTFIWVDQYLRNPPSPVIGGLYYIKSYPTSPLIYRGRGTGAYRKFKLGDKVWCDGLGMGCTLLHRSILELVAAKAPKDQGVPRVFNTPKEVFYDPESSMWSRKVGTEDLDFLDRVREGKLLGKTKWKSLVSKKYPYLVDTGLFCWHMDIHGQRFPLDNDLPSGFGTWMGKQRTTKWASVG